MGGRHGCTIKKMTGENQNPGGTGIVFHAFAQPSRQRKNKSYQNDNPDSIVRTVLIITGHTVQYMIPSNGVQKAINMWQKLFVYHREHRGL